MGILPTLDNLLMRMLQVEGTCHVCAEQNEMIFHIMFECIFSRRVWMGCCPCVMEVTQDLTTEGLVLKRLFIKAVLVKKVKTRCTTLWLLWHNRNNVVHDKCWGNHNGIIRKVNEIPECRNQETL